MRDRYKVVWILPVKMDCFHMSRNFMLEEINDMIKLMREEKAMGRMVVVF